jgi:hypothetical protein
VTVTSTVDRGRPAGVVAVIDDAELTVKLDAGFVPKLTVVAPVNEPPVIVTTVSPAEGPSAGESPVRVGIAAMYLN